MKRLDNIDPSGWEDDMKRFRYQSNEHKGGPNFWPLVIRLTVIALCCFGLLMALLFKIAN